MACYENETVKVSKTDKRRIQSLSVHEEDIYVRLVKSYSIIKKDVLNVIKGYNVRHYNIRHITKRIKQGNEESLNEGIRLSIDIVLISVSEDSGILCRLFILYCLFSCKEKV